MRIIKCFVPLVIILFSYLGAFAQAQSLELRITCNDKGFAPTASLNCVMSMHNRTAHSYYYVDAGYNTSYEYRLRRLGVAFEKETTSFDYFEWPRLLKLRGRSTLKRNVTIPLTRWSEINSGRWILTVSAGVIRRSLLDSKLKSLGGQRGRLNAEEFLKLQQVVYADPLVIDVRL